MLHRVTNKLVEGPGFSVSVPDIHRVQYKDGTRTAYVEIEGGMGEDGRINWIVYSTTLRGWEEPHHFDELRFEEKKEILNRISESLNILQMPHQVD